MYRQKYNEERKQRFEAAALVHIDSLYRTALFMTKNEQEAKDLTQETYLRAYRFFDKFKPGTNCKAWLFKILQNNHINKCRNKSKESFTEGFTEINPYCIQLERDGETNPEKSFFKKLSNENIRQAIEDLPEEWRLSVILADIENFSYKEIAEITKFPLGTVMSKLYRGRNVLRKKLLSLVKEKNC